MDTKADLKLGVRPNTNMSINRLWKNAFTIDALTGDTTLRTAGGGATNAALELLQAATTTAVENLALAPVNTVAPALLKLSNAATLADAHSVSITNTGAVAGTVLGTALAVGESASFQAPIGNKITGLAYDATGTEFTVVSIT